MGTKAIYIMIDSWFLDDHNSYHHNVTKLLGVQATDYKSTNLVSHSVPLKQLQVFSFDQIAN